MQLARIDDETWIGTYLSCGTSQLSPSVRVIHVWHESQPGHCERASGLAVEYREHDPLAAEMLQSIWD